MKKPSILERRFNNAIRNQKKLTFGELQKEVNLAEKIGAEKFRADCFSVFLKNNKTNKKKYSAERYAQ